MTSLTDAIGLLAGCASQQTLGRIIAVVNEADSPGQAFRTRARRDLRSPKVRERTMLLADTWEEHADVPAGTLVAMLSAAGAAAESVRSDQRLRLVWTGPPTDAIAPYSGSEAILRVVKAAQDTLILSTFNSTKDPELVDALKDRLQAGVEMWLVGETKEDAPHDFSGDSAAKLAELQEHGLRFYRWPKAQREDWIAHLGLNLHAMLHAKVAVADARHLLVTSANLSTNGMYSNMEMGVYVEGGRHPVAVDRHFRELKEKGLLRWIA